MRSPRSWWSPTARSRSTWATSSTSSDCRRRPTTTGACSPSLPSSEANRRVRRRPTFAGPMVIRAAVAGESTLLTEIHRRASYIWVEDRPHLHAHPEIFGVDARSLAEGRVRVASVGPSEQILGFATWRPAGGDDAELDRLFVEPDALRRGSGRGVRRPRRDAPRNRPRAGRGRRRTGTSGGTVASARGRPPAHARLLRARRVREDGRCRHALRAGASPRAHALIRCSEVLGDS